MSIQQNINQVLSSGAFLASTNPAIRAAAEKKTAMKAADKAVSIAEARVEEIEKQQEELPISPDTDDVLQDERELASQGLVKALEQRYAADPNSEDFKKILEEKKFLKEMEAIRETDWQPSTKKGNARAEEIRTQQVKQKEGFQERLNKVRTEGMKIREDAAAAYNLPLENITYDRKGNLSIKKGGAR